MLSDPHFSRNFCFQLSDTLLLKSSWLAATWKHRDRLYGWDDNDPL